MHKMQFFFCFAFSHLCEKAQLVAVFTRVLVVTRKIKSTHFLRKKFNFVFSDGKFLVSWGNFHLGFSSNTDPEPGRCRRTDGKKWRCSRDAVADQKYCERHMNRGRHRSRKPVEGQSGHSAAAASTTTAKSMPTAASSSSMSATVGGLHGGSGGGSSNSLAITQQQQLKHLQSDSSSNLSTATPLGR